VLFILEGDEWRELRALMRPAFMNHSLSSLATDTAATAQILSQQLEAWEKRCPAPPARARARARARAPVTF
jgi:cytochrome P450